MIKKLRRKFIAAAMISVFTVLVLILGSILIVNYESVKSTADERIELIEDNGGYFPNTQDFFAIFGFSDKGRLTQETPFDTRYFSVKFNSSGEAVSVYTESIAAVDDETAVELAQSITGKSRTEGFYGIYRYRVSDYVNGKLVIFVDVAREIESFRSFLSACIAAGVIGILLVFGLVVFFSKIVVKPMAESYEKQKRFITDASHEIKTPLAIINSANEVVEMENGESEWTRSISNQVGRLTSLTQKLVMLSRMDEESYKPQKINFNLSDVCLDTAHSFDAVAQTKEKIYEVNICPDITYNGDEQSIIQLVSLLLDNAMKYSSEKGRIAFSLTANGKNKVITVENTVDEIKKGNLNILFERFYRNDSSRSSKTGGSGIGLSVARAIVNAHGGKISAQSPDGKSIIFTVLL